MPDEKNDDENGAKSPAGSRKGGSSLHSTPNYLFWCLHKTSMSIVTEELERAGTDLTPLQFAALTTIQINPGIDQATLAHEIGYDRATIGGVLDRLEKKGLMSRQVHPQDRRARALFIEEAGIHLVADLEAKVAEAQRKILSPLPEKDHAQFLNMVARLIRDDLPHASDF
jgi:DNA-binding MarR family transcriptional regulator